MPSRTDLSFSISPRSAAVVLSVVAVVLSLLSWLAHFAHYALRYDNLFGFRGLFDVGSDISIPTWYSSFALLISAILLGLIATVKTRNAERYAKHWAALAIIFLLMSVDEVAGFHERSGQLLSRFVETTGVLYYSWVILGIAFVIVFVIAYLGFLVHLPPRTRNLFIVAGAVFVGGALGVEMYNSRYEYLYGMDLHYQTTTTIEEFLEKIGIVIFIYALLSYMRKYLPSFYIRIDGAEDGRSGSAVKI
ncbi:MAG: hypothetical protein H0U67_04465 [Gemmatimonadetes bacterium]|nr:hypothetical protein [Gemmatimonadota bacterium]MBA4160113.1 hypothetical protein [Gemmatimonadota bacterium]